MLHANYKENLMTGFSANVKTEFIGLFIFLHAAEVCLVVIFGELRIKSVRGLFFVTFSMPLLCWFHPRARH